jgi:hypothetical protein
MILLVDETLNSKLIKLKDFSKLLNNFCYNIFLKNQILETCNPKNKNKKLEEKVETLFIQTHCILDGTIFLTSIIG